MALMVDAVDGYLMVPSVSMMMTATMVYCVDVAMMIVMTMTAMIIMLMTYTVQLMTVPVVTCCRRQHQTALWTGMRILSRAMAQQSRGQCESGGSSGHQVECSSAPWPQQQQQQA